MAFNLYFAGCMDALNDWFVENCPCRLFSYCNERKEIDYFTGKKYKGKLFVDSGAFSVAHAGAKVDIDAYIDFINASSGIEVFAELDKIPYPLLNQETALASSEESWENYLYMMSKIDDPDKRAKVLPVFHFGEPIEALQRILNTEVRGARAPYICIGGRHGVSMSLQEQYFAKIFDVIATSKNPNVKVHVLGMTSLPMLKKFPFYSADSTSYLQTASFGTVYTKYGPVVVSDRSVEPNALHNLPKDAQEQVVAELERHGYTLQGVQTNYKDRITYNVTWLVEWAKAYTYQGTMRPKGLF